eukprot:g23122.t1
MTWLDACGAEKNNHQKTRGTEATFVKEQDTKTSSQSSEMAQGKEDLQSEDSQSKRFSKACGQTSDAACFVVAELDKTT